MRHLVIALLILCFTGCQTSQKAPEVGSELGLLDEETREIWELAHDGDSEAQNRLAIRYLDGTGGLSESIQRAYEWFKRSAEGGNPWAMSNLARMYRDEDTIGVDLEQAETWFLKSAEAGNYQAMANLGEHFASGNGGVIDFQKASFWYSRAVLGPFDPWIANNAAWFFSTVEDESLMKPELSVNLMLRVISTREIYYEFDTLAAAYAAQGDFDSAIIAQQRALEMGYDNEVDAAEMEDFESRLSTYFDRQRFIFYKSFSE